MDFVILGALAMAYVAFWIFVFVTLLLRRDLTDTVKLVWALVMALVPLGVFVYVVFGPPQIRGVLR